MSLEKLKEISLFEGKTLDEIFGVIYSQSLEERKEAMKADRNGVASYLAAHAN